MGKNIKSKLYCETTIEDFCAVDDDVVVSLLLDDAEMIKEVCQKTIESSHTDEENETF